MRIITGRDREVSLIRQANRAAAVGRLMLGRFENWNDFLMADAISLADLPRRKLKSGSYDVKGRLTSEIKNFCIRNFQGMSEEKLSRLYEKIKAFRGLELPLVEFENEFAVINPKTLHGCPKHLTVCISLWGLQFKFPESQIAKDIIKGLDMANAAIMNLKGFESKPHRELSSRTRIGELVQERNFAIRSVVTSCFNLAEAYLNGLAWDFMQTTDTTDLSNIKRKILDDSASVNTKEKLIKYPDIIAGKPLWNDTDPELDQFLKTVKPFRDSLTHPSPFLAPARFGGYDKLRLFYRVDYNLALDAARLLAGLLIRVHRHIYSEQNNLPTWLKEFELSIKSKEKVEDPLNSNNTSE